MAQVNGRRHEPPSPLPLNGHSRSDARDGPASAAASASDESRHGRGESSADGRAVDPRRSPPASERRGRVSSGANGMKASSSSLLLSEGLPMAPRSTALPPRPFSLPSKPASTPSTASTPTTGPFLTAERASPVKISFGSISRPSDRRDSVASSRARRESNASSRPSGLLSGTKASFDERDAALRLENGVKGEDDLETAALKALLVESSVGQPRGEWYNGLKVTAKALQGPLLKAAGASSVSQAKQGGSALSEASRPGPSIPAPKRSAPSLPLSLSLPARPDAALAQYHPPPPQRDDYRASHMTRRPSSSASTSSTDPHPRRRRSPIRDRRKSPVRGRQRDDVYVAESSDEERSRPWRTEDGRCSRYDSPPRTHRATSPAYRDDRTRDRSRSRSRDGRDSRRRQSRYSPDRGGYASERDRGHYSPPRRRDSPAPVSHAMSRTPSYESPPHRPARHAKDADRYDGQRRRGADAVEDGYVDSRRNAVDSRWRGGDADRSANASTSSARRDERAYDRAGSSDTRARSPNQRSRRSATNARPAEEPPAPPLDNGTGIKVKLKYSATISPSVPTAEAPEASASPAPAIQATLPTPVINGNSTPRRPAENTEATWEAPQKPRGFCHQPGRGNFRVKYDPDTDGGKGDKGKERLVRLDGVDRKGRVVEATDPRKLLKTGSRGLGSKSNRETLHTVPAYPWDERSTGPKPAPPPGGITVTGLNLLTSEATVHNHVRRFGPIHEYGLKNDPRTGESLGIFWVKFQDSKVPGASAHDIAKTALSKTRGIRIGMSIQAQSERVAVVLDGSGAKAAKAVEQELARRKVAAAPKPSAKDTKTSASAKGPASSADKAPVKVATEDSRKQVEAVPKPVSAAHAVPPPQPHPSLAQAPRQPAWGQARIASPWAFAGAKAASNAPGWQRLQQERQADGIRQPLYMNLPFHPLNPNRVRDPARPQSGQQVPFASSTSSAAAQRGFRQPVAVPRISAASFAAAPQANDGDSQADSEPEDEDDQNARAARLPAVRMRAQAAELETKEAKRRAKQVAEALAENGNPYVFIDKKVVPLGPDSTLKLQSAFGLVKSQAILYDNHGWYVLFHDDKAAKRVIKVVEGKRIDGRQILAEVREAAVASPRPPLAERQAGNAVPSAALGEQHDKNEAAGVKATSKRERTPDQPASGSSHLPTRSEAEAAPALHTEDESSPAAVKKERDLPPPGPAPQEPAAEDEPDVVLTATTSPAKNVMPVAPSVASETTLLVPSKRKPAAKERKAKQPAKKKQKKRVKSPNVELEKPAEFAEVISLSVPPSAPPTAEAIPASQAVPLIDDPIAAGIVEDDEEAYLLSQLIKRIKEDNHPVAPSVQPHQIDQDAKHFTGCARTQGYYKVSELEKNAYLPSRNRAAIQEDQPAAATAAATTTGNAASTTVTSRSNRVATRRLVQGLQQHQKATATDTDVFQFNQLRARKKHLKFSKSPIHDWGLYAMECIPAGEMVIEYVGEVIRAQVAELREKYYEKTGIGSSYLFRVDDDAVVDATKKGNLGRLINHCCAPNCTAKIITINGEKKIVIYAKTTIEPGEEITYDYHFPIENNKIPCLCGSPKCRGYLN